MSARVDALAWHLERQFGRKVPQCPNCGSHELTEDYARNSWHCKTCRYEISCHVMNWVPKDESVRLPNERGEVKPENSWLMPPR